MRRFGLCVVVGLAAVGVAVVPAGAGSVDQVNELRSVGGINTFCIHDHQRAAQTFTAGRTGLLDQVDIVVKRETNDVFPSVVAPLEVEIQGVVAGVPAGMSLATTLVAPADVPPHWVWPPTFVSVPLATPVAVTAGGEYAIVLRSVTPSYYCGYGWVEGAGPYAMGRGLTSWYPFANWLDPFNFEFDYAFRTYVLSGSVTGYQLSSVAGGHGKVSARRNRGGVVGYLEWKRAGERYTAASLLELDIFDAGRAVLTGTLTDGRPFRAELEDGGARPQHDRFNLSVDGVSLTGDGQLDEGKITVTP
jgi:hypothetical protein